LITRETAGDSSLKKMAKVTKASLGMIKKMAKGFRCGPTAESSKDFGRKTNS